MEENLIKILEGIINHHFKTAEKLKEMGLDKSVDYWYHCARGHIVKGQLETLKNGLVF